jgi:fucose permease
VLLGFVVDRLGVDRVVRFGLGCTIVGALLLATNVSSAASALALVILGLGLAPIFPCLMTRTPQRFGKAVAAHAIGAQVSAAMIGAAALPSLAGFFAQRLGLESIATGFVTVACSLVLLHEILLAWQKRWVA